MVETAEMTGLVLSEKDFREISDAVHRHCGINLHMGKKELVRARLAKLLRVRGLRTFSEYMKMVQEDASGREFATLVDALSTNLTSFFREGQHFEYLREKFLPQLMERKGSTGSKIRGWSAGCSSGEEPYSIALTLLDALQGAGRWDVKLLATDIAMSKVEIAQRGIYEKGRVDSVPGQLRSRYMSRTREGRYEMGPQLREAVVFRYMNLMEEWPFKGPMDFIFCRNVMIYFDKPTQQKLVERFWQMLEPGGILFTGHSESLTGIAHRFGYIQPTIYAKPWR